jgi:hypothetical protein
MKFMRALGVLLAITLLAPSPGAAEPFKIAFVGDSMADGIWGGAQRRASRDSCLRNALQFGRFAELGTGLARLDKFDWIGRIKAISSQFAPDVIVVSMGLNDRTTVVDQSGRDRVDLSNPNWQSAYRSHVTGFVNAARQSNATILWVGLPILRDEAANRDGREKNNIFRGVISSFNQSGLLFVEPWRLSSSELDTYEPFSVIGDSKVQLRASDGVHFTSAGYDLLAQYLWPYIMSVHEKVRGPSPAKEDACLMSGTTIR